MGTRIQFTERGVEDMLDELEITEVFNWRTTPELLHVGLTELFMEGLRGGKLANVSTVWIPGNRALGAPEFETMVSGLAEHHDDLSTLERWTSRSQAVAGHWAAVRRIQAALQAAHPYDEIHAVDHDHTYRLVAARPR